MGVLYKKVLYNIKKIKKWGGGVGRGQVGGGGVRGDQGGGVRVDVNEELKFL